MEMRDRVERFVAAGGNAAFLSGNTCWWQVRFEDNDQTIVCFKNREIDPVAQTDPTRTTVHWHEAPVNRPANSLTWCG